MSYVYKFIPAGHPIQKNAKDSYKDEFQAVIRDYFYQSTDWFTIEEETSVGSEQYQNVDARLGSIINPTTGDNIEDDYKKITFKEIDHSIDLGKFYKFNNNYWITINVDKVKTLAQTVLVKRCNNVLRWIDESTGALYQSPCSLGYLIKENRDYATAGSAVVIPSGMIDCFYQINSKTNKLKANQRFLFGNQHTWTAYRIEGGGINNYMNQETENNSSAYLGRLGMTVDFSNVDTDDTTNLIANYYDNRYVISLVQSSISGGIGQTVSLSASVTLNGSTVSRNLVWASSNSAIATVNSSGLVTFIGSGSCTITCSLENNSLVSAPCAVTVVGSPVDNYQVIISPNKNYVLEGSEQTWSVYLYKNNVIQADLFVFTLDSNTVPSSNYEYSVLGGNSFKIRNIERFLTDVLEVNCVSGLYSKIIAVQLKGAW